MRRLLTDEEMKAVNLDIPICNQKVFDCWGCSGNCKAVAEAQDAKTKRMIFAELKKYCPNKFERLSLDDLELLENQL